MLGFPILLFDAEFLGHVIGAPIRSFLQHRLHVDLLGSDLPQVLSVPWQSYPGHIPCSLPLPVGLAYQWSKDYCSAATHAHLRRHKLEKASRLLGLPRFPRQLIDGWRLRVAGWLTRLGAGDFSYVIDATESYADYWGRIQHTAELAG